MVMVACVASVLRGWPRTLDLAKKLESHSALSPCPSGGILTGGAAGSNVWLAKTTGSLLITTGVSPGERPDETSFGQSSLKLWQPETSAASNTQGTIGRRNRNIGSAFHFPEDASLNHEFVCAV